MKTTVNAQSLKQHITYNWWKYLLVLAAGTFLVDLLFVITAPKIPREKSISLYVYGYADTEKLDGYMDNVREKEMPEMEEMRSVLMMPDDTYGPMQLMTYMAAGEGDLYLLPREQFLSLSAEGAFLPLEDDQELMGLFNQIGADLKRGWRTNNDETHLVGIPESFLPGLSSYCQAGDGFICILPNAGNAENALRFLRILCRDMIFSPGLSAEEAKSDQQ